MGDVLNNVILVVIFGPLAVLAIAVGASKIKEELEFQRQKTSHSSGDVLHWCVMLGAVSGMVGFLLMFVFLALGIPTHIPVAMMALALPPMFVAIIAIIFTSGK